MALSEILNYCPRKYTHQLAIVILIWGIYQIYMGIYFEINSWSNSPNDDPNDAQLISVPHSHKLSGDKVKMRDDPGYDLINANDLPPELDISNDGLMNLKNNKIFQKWTPDQQAEYLSKVVHKRRNKDSEPSKSTDGPFMAYPHIPTFKSRGNKWIHPNNPKADKCGYKGKVFVIGMMKTGTNTLRQALSQLGYLTKWKPMPGLNRNTCTWMFQALWDWYSNFNYPNFVGADDISWLFWNEKLYEHLLSMSDESFNFGDSPWLFMYQIFDQLYPNSKFILTIRNSTWDLVNSDVKMEMRHRYKKKSWINKTLESLDERTTYKVSVREFAMLIARRYEYHNEKIMKYFGYDWKQPRENKRLLVMNLWNDTLPWKTLMEFLECDPEKLWAYDAKEIGEHNVSPEGLQQKRMLPDDIDLNWRDFKFSDEYQDLFDLVQSFSGDVDYERNKEFYDKLKGFYKFWGPDKDNATHDKSMFDYI